MFISAQVEGGHGTNKENLQVQQERKEKHSQAQNQKKIK